MPKVPGTRIARYGTVRPGWRARRQMRQGEHRVTATQPDGSKLGPNNSGRLKASAAKTGLWLGAATVPGVAAFEGMQHFGTAAGKERAKRDHRKAVSKKETIYRVTAYGTRAGKASEHAIRGLDSLRTNKVAYGLTGVSVAGGGYGGYKLGDWASYKSERARLKRVQARRERAAARRAPKVDVAKRNLSQKEIDRRKKAQAKVSITTGTLGLGSLGAFGLSAALKRPRVAAAAAKAPVIRRVTSEGAKTTAVGLSSTGGGIGGLGAYNFAAYSNAEAKQRKKKVPVRKSAFGIEHVEKKLPVKLRLVPRKVAAKPDPNDLYWERNIARAKARAASAKHEIDLDNRKWKAGIKPI